MPGGDQIGSAAARLAHRRARPSSVPSSSSEHGYIIAKAPHGLTGATVWLDFPSVGATENVLMAVGPGAGHDGHRQRGPRARDRRPRADAASRWAPRSTASARRRSTIEGVDRLSPAEHAIVPDRIVAGTWAFAAAMTRGDITVRNARPEHLEIALDKLVSAGAVVDEHRRRLPGVDGPTGRRAVDAVTLPYPGLPPTCSRCSSRSTRSPTAPRWSPRTSSRVASCSSTRWCASAPTCAPTATTPSSAEAPGFPVHRSRPPTSAPVPAWPSPASSPTGVTTSTTSHHVDRGYPGFDEQLRALGADVTREPDPDAEFTG